MCVGETWRYYSSHEPYSKKYCVTSLNDNPCTALMKSNGCYRVTTTPAASQLLSRAAFKWNNEVEQIGGNFDNKPSSARRAEINGARGHLHMAFFRRAMFDLWRSWVVSMSERRTLASWDHSAPHLIFMSAEEAARTNACSTGKCAYESISKS